MQVSFNTNNDKTGFGKYFGPRLKRVQNVFEKGVYEGYLNNLTKLEDLGKKADIYVRVRGYSGVEDYDGFVIKVAPLAKFGIGRILNLCNKNKVLKSGVVIADELYEAPKKINELVLNRITEMVADINK